MKNDIIEKILISGLMAKRKNIEKDYVLINAKYKLSAGEIKLVLSLISIIKEKDEPFKNYKLSVNNENSNILKKYCSDLMGKPLEVVTEDGWKVFNWFADIEYSEKENIITYSLSPKLKPYLLKLQNKFKPYNLQYVLRMKSEYSIRLYELLIPNKEKKEIYFTLEELYKIFKVPASLANYSQLNQKMIKIAQKELKQNSDICFEYKEKKLVRKVIGINFIIKKNEKKDMS